ncbi:hypothetical protein A1Q1_07712 [Trichosporon asahii var. asahii CBS 2479]|uniref:Uncharacterized protein n=1 Tax=Trichosporon asahii var. asahii (strain ATCC 90039 / CBS 2479 / JCM 2466 / KCTC 7840 / NBRC 103889/ NCYC 2677 / UAMH 7654) TaxID=1186058 RepID=J6F708_TRIAS|nr:hypothetical protein A1Q1_07712 [Trichosporon asahii var. asahii CBS 2479]EJT51117.1 hypothetical protein A1Q1_07712 [Trichosporon asahii var. asahii CBS 2479]
MRIALAAYLALATAAAAAPIRVPCDALPSSTSATPAITSENADSGSGGEGEVAAENSEGHDNPEGGEQPAEGEGDKQGDGNGVGGNGGDKGGEGEEGGGNHEGENTDDGGEGKEGGKGGGEGNGEPAPDGNHGDGQEQGDNPADGNNGQENQGNGGGESHDEKKENADGGEQKEGNKKEENIIGYGAFAEVPADNAPPPQGANDAVALDANESAIADKAAGVAPATGAAGAVAGAGAAGAAVGATAAGAAGTTNGTGAAYGGTTGPWAATAVPATAGGTAGAAAAGAAAGGTTGSAPQAAAPNGNATTPGSALAAAGAAAAAGAGPAGGVAGAVGAGPAGQAALGATPAAGKAAAENVAAGTLAGAGAAGAAVGVPANAAAMGAAAAGISAVKGATATTAAAEGSTTSAADALKASQTMTITEAYDKVFDPNLDPNSMDQKLWTWWDGYLGMSDDVGFDKFDVVNESQLSLYRQIDSKPERFEWRGPMASRQYRRERFLATKHKLEQFIGTEAGKNTEADKQWQQQALEQKQRLIDNEVQKKANAAAGVTTTPVGLQATTTAKAKTPATWSKSKNDAVMVAHPTQTGKTTEERNKEFDAWYSNYLLTESKASPKTAQAKGATGVAAVSTIPTPIPISTIAYNGPPDPAGEIKTIWALPSATTDDAKKQQAKENIKNILGAIKAGVKDRRDIAQPTAAVNAPPAPAEPASSEGDLTMLKLMEMVSAVIAAAARKDPSIVPDPHTLRRRSTWVLDFVPEGPSSGNWDDLNRWIERCQEWRTAARDEQDRYAKMGFQMTDPPLIPAGGDWNTIVRWVESAKAWRSEWTYKAVWWENHRVDLQAFEDKVRGWFKSVFGSTGKEVKWQ